MASETVTIGDTEVEIRETDDGFEAVEVTEEKSGFYLRGEDGRYGFEIPFGADYVVEERDADSSFAYGVAFDTDDDVSDLDNMGGAGGLAREHDFDGHVNISKLEIVEY